MSVKSFSRLNYAARNFNVVAATMVPVYSVSASSSSINEGTTVTYTITTQYVLNGTVLYWTTSGTTVAADFSDGVTSGSVTMTDGTATIVRTLTSDIIYFLIVEGEQYKYRPDYLFSYFPASGLGSDRAAIPIQ